MFIEDSHDVRVPDNFEPFYAESIKRHTLDVQSVRAKEMLTGTPPQQLDTLGRDPGI